jgi:protein SCO1/2
MQKAIVKVLVVAVGVLLTACDETPENSRVLPIVGDRDVVYKTVDGEEVADTIYHHVPEFEYFNQDSVMIKSEDLKGKIWITDFFFTRCPSICPPMTSNMKRLNEDTKDLDEHVQFLSFSIDPDRDTPTTLRNYISSYSINDDNWYFFTGDEEETHLLAKEFFNGAERNDEIAGGFGHTSYFAIVDTEGLVRGIYDGTNTDQVDQLEKDLRKLLKYEYNIDNRK